MDIDGCEAMTFFMPENLEWDGSLNSEVLAAAGTELDDFVVDNVTKPRSGNVYTLPPCNMPHKALFMAVLSEWDGGVDFNDRDLVRCYKGAVEKAQEEGIRSLAFPAMGKDKRDFPHIRFARLALQGILEKLDDRIDSVTIACADQRMFTTYKDRLLKMGWRDKPVV